ncbi:MAG: prepilin-type N-terminal cleavage/methylation domain-containing protein [Elusimicrobiota bacterium]
MNALIDVRSIGRRPPWRPAAGFTLIELMIVVAIIGILAAIAIPKFADLIRKSNEGATKGNIGAIRSALSIYYGDMEGLFPDNPTALTLGAKYLSAMPTAKTPSYHADSAAVVLGSAASDMTDAGGWAYGNVPSVSTYGSIFVNCTHTDSKGVNFGNY